MSSSPTTQAPPRPGRASARSARPQRARNPHLQLLAAAAVFAALVAVFFQPVLLEDKTLSAIAGHQSIQYPWAATPTGFPDVVQSDQANNVYPIQADLNRLVRRGEFPFWSQYSFAGGPTLGTVYGSGFYPPRLLLSLVLAPIQIHDLFLLFHVWLAGMAVFLLARRLGASWLAGVLGGVAWMFCPAWFGLAILEGGAVLAALLPLALWSMHRAVIRRSVPDAVGCGAILALLVLGASVQPAVFCFTIVAGWGLVLGLRQPVPGDSRRATLVRAARPVAVAAGLGVALCAFVVLPATAQIGDSERAPVPYEQLAQQDVGLDDLAHAIDGDPPVLTGDSVWALTYVGLPVALLFLLGLFSRRPGAGLGRTLVIVFALLVVGTPLTRVAYSVVPGFAYLSPLGRLLPFLSFGVALLALLGVDVLRDLVGRHVAAQRRRRAVAAVAVVVVGLAAVEAWQVMGYSRDVNPRFQPRSRAYLYPPTPLIRALYNDARRQRASGDVQRLVPIRPGASGDPFVPPTMIGETPRLFSLESIGGYLNVLPARSRALSLILSGSDPGAAQASFVGAYEAFFYSAGTRYDLLERIGVSEIVSGPGLAQDAPLAAAAQRLGAQQLYEGGDGTLLRLPRAAPRAFVVDGVETADSADAAVRRFIDPAFPFRTTVLLDGDGAERNAEQPSTGRIDARVRVLPGGPSERNVEVDTPRAGWLVVLDSFDDGWTATVDGRREPIARADYAFRAVKVPAGHSVVEMRYTTPALRLGAAVTVAGLLAALGLLGWSLIRRGATR